MTNLDHNKNLLIQSIREAIKTREDQVFINQLEATEGASIESFEFQALLNIYKALLTGKIILK